MENWQVKKLIKSLEGATKTLEKLNDELEKACKRRYTDEEKQNFIDCVRAYCLVHGIRARFNTRDKNLTRIEYYYLDEEPIKPWYGDQPCGAAIMWDSVDDITECLNSVLDNIHHRVVKEM